MREHSEQVWFAGSNGDRLSGRLDLPSVEPAAYVLFVHCFTCSRDLLAATRITHRLVARGYGVLRFDFTGLGASEGDFASTNFSSNVEDIVCAADMLRRRNAAPKILVGHSLGGAAVLGAAARVPEAVAAVTIGAPFDLTELTRLFPEALAKLDQDTEVIVDIGGRPFPVRRQLFDDLNTQNLTEAIRSLPCALLVFHAPTDEVVAIDNARRIFDAAKHPKSFVSLDNADHLLTRDVDAAYVADVLAAWASRYLDAHAEPEPPRRTDGAVIVTDSPRGRVAEEIRVGRHAFVSDEPAGVGDDLGPTPYDLLLASLGACTAMTLRLYAERKGWPLERVSIRLTHDRIHVDDARGFEETRSMVDRIDGVVDVIGPLSEAQRRRLLDIAQRCPVHRTLTRGTQIVTRPGSPETRLQ